MAATNNSENIENLIPSPITSVSHQTMGYQKMPINPPASAQFLSADESQSVHANTSESNIKLPCRNNGKSCLPRTRPKAPVKPTQKNFIQMNIMDVMRNMTPLPKCRVQDSKTRHVLDESDLKQIYDCKNRHCRTLSKIRKFNRDREEERIEAERIKETKQQLHALSRVERHDILHGLRTDRARLYNKYLLLPITPKTTQKVRRKKSLEKKLMDLDKDIELMLTDQEMYMCQDMD